jgi:hypothetical protein
LPEFALPVRPEPEPVTVAVSGIVQVLRGGDDLLRIVAMLTSLTKSVAVKNLGTR